MSDHLIHIRLEGPEVTSETTYGPRTNRETLASVTVKVDAVLGWELVAHLIAEVSPEHPNTEGGAEA